MTTVRIAAALLLLGACGGERRAEPSPPPPDEPPPPNAVQVPRTEPAAPPSPAWLTELLAFDLHGDPTDERTMALGARLGMPVTCPRPGTGCFVELELGEYTCQVHFGDDEALQVWGPTHAFSMTSWVASVEQDIDRSELTAVNEPGTRPDRLWRDARHVVLLHDHSEQPCGGFCPAMVWIAPPDHPAAHGYGF